MIQPLASLLPAAASVFRFACARSMAQIARDIGQTREAPYKALRPNANPRFDNIARACKALGLKLVAQPVTHSR